MKILQVIFYIFFLHIANAQAGFFLNDWKPKTAVIPPAVLKKQYIGKAAISIFVNPDKVVAKISPYLYGNNTNPYMTQIVSQPVLMEQLKELAPGILRFPGGNLSNLYFWDAKAAQKPDDVPDTILYGDGRKVHRSKFWYGKDNDPQTLSLENYYRLLKETKSTGTICVNAGYARYGLSKDPIATAAHYAADWVRYDNGRTKFWEVGNEDYGQWQAGYKINTLINKDAQPEITSGIIYGEIFKAFADSMRLAAKQTGAQIYIGATIIEAPKNKPYDKEVERSWNEQFFKTTGNAADFFIVHSYYTPYEENSTVAGILDSAVPVTAGINAYINSLTKTLDVQMKPLALTEWNIFAVHSKQQTSFVNGVHAALVLGALAKNNFGMACRWNLANGYNHGNDHGMFNKGDEPGMPLWSARPAYYYMYYFDTFFGDKLIDACSDDADVVVYASVFSNYKMGIVVINKNNKRQVAAIHFNNAKRNYKSYGYTLTGGNDLTNFSQQVIINDIKPILPAGGPKNFKTIKAWSINFQGALKIVLPPLSVQYILID